MEARRNRDRGHTVSPMRKPKGKLIALLAGAVAVPLLTLAVLFWKGVYCHLYHLDPRLVGRWESEVSWSSLPPTLPPSPDPFVRLAWWVEFDLLGNFEMTLTPEGIPTLRGLNNVWGTYRVNGKSLRMDWSGAYYGKGTDPTVIKGAGEMALSFTIYGDSLTLASRTYRRVPDDS